MLPRQERKRKNMRLQARTSNLNLESLKRENQRLKEENAELESKLRKLESLIKELKIDIEDLKGNWTGKLKDEK